MPAHSVSSQSSAITLNGRRGDGVDLARDGGGQRDEVDRRVGHVAQFVGVRVVDIGDRVQPAISAAVIRWTEGRPANPRRIAIVEIGGAGAEHDDQGERARPAGRLAHGIDELAGLRRAGQSSKRTRTTLTPPALRAKSPAGSRSS